MTTIKFSLPDKLAQDAAEAGLFEPLAFEEMLRQRLKEDVSDEWLSKLPQGGEDEPGYMSPEDVAEEIAVMRAERRAVAS